MDTARISCRGFQRQEKRKQGGQVMKGHIRERSPGKWAIILDIRDPETGKRKRRWHSFRGTKREAQDRVLAADLRIAGRHLHRADRETVAAFLDRWLDHIKGQVARVA